MTSPQQLEDLLAGLGLSDVVAAVCQRPSNEDSGYVGAGVTLYKNTVYGIELHEGESIAGWAIKKLSSNHDAISPERIAILTPIPDLSDGETGGITTIFAADWVTMKALLIEISSLFDVVCIGPVQALCGPYSGRVTEVVEDLLATCSPTYAAHQKTPPVLLFNDGGSQDRTDVQLMRQYASMLS